MCHGGGGGTRKITYFQMFRSRSGLGECRSVDVFMHSMEWGQGKFCVCVKYRVPVANSLQVCSSQF